MVVAIPTAVILNERDRQLRPFGKLDWLFELEHRLAILIALSRPGVDCPGRLVLAVDGQSHGADHALLARAIVEIWFERAFGLLEIGRRFCEFEFRCFA